MILTLHLGKIRFAVETSPALYRRAQQKSTEKHYVLNALSVPNAMQVGSITAFSAAGALGGRKTDVNGTPFLCVFQLALSGKPAHSLVGELRCQFSFFGHIRDIYRIGGL
jgi:hypothetical protein